MNPCPPEGSSKLKKIQALRAILAREKKGGKKIVFTNGCFDVLHTGHVRYLHRARKLGDILIVGLNTDASVKKLKGAGRPVNSQNDRAEVLGSLAVVDYMVLFPEATPLNLIHATRPDFLVKGGDWKKKDIVGSAFVESYGGQVRPLPFIKGFSTTGVLEKMSSSRGGEADERSRSSKRDFSLRSK